MQKQALWLLTDELNRKVGLKKQKAALLYKTNCLIWTVGVRTVLLLLWLIEFCCR